MKYFSDVTKKTYETVEALEKAEAEANASKKADEKKREERSKRAKEVEDAFKSAREAEKGAEELLSKFCKDYGSYHTTVTEPLTSLFDSFLDSFLF